MPPVKDPCCGDSVTVPLFVNTLNYDRRCVSHCRPGRRNTASLAVASADLQGDTELVSENVVPKCSNSAFTLSVAITNVFDLLSSSSGTVQVIPVDQALPVPTTSTITTIQPANASSRFTLAFDLSFSMAP